MPLQELDRLRFGPAGIPNSYSGPAEGAIAFVKELGLDAMELEFVRNIWLKPEKAEVFKELSRKHDVVLTAHAPYYINLNSRDPKKVEASIWRILKSADVLYKAGGFSVVFHPAFYHDDRPEAVTEKMRKMFKRIENDLKERGIDVWVRPELMGKRSQWGDLRELLDATAGFDLIEPAIDFAHLHARYVGRYNSAEEWREVLSLYEDVLGSDALKRMHIHISGINYGKNGEKNHVNLRESDLKFEDLLKVLKEFNVRGVVISESPNLEEDALLMKRTYEKIKGKGTKRA